MVIRVKWTRMNNLNQHDYKSYESHPSNDISMARRILKALGNLEVILLYLHVLDILKCYQIGQTVILFLIIQNTGSLPRCIKFTNIMNLKGISWVGWGETRRVETVYGVWQVAPLEHTNNRYKGANTRWYRFGKKISDKIINAFRIIPRF